MADFTMQLRDVVAALDKTIAYERLEVAGVNYGSLPVLSGGAPIGLEDYPIHEEDYRQVLNGKIIDRFFFREIAHESIGVFIHRLRVTMNEIMPQYAPMYQSITFDEAMRTTDIKTTSTSEQTSRSESEANSDSTGSTESKSRSINLAFPQTALAGNADYAESGVDVSGQGGNTGSATETGEQSSEAAGSGESHTIGRSGSAVDALMAYRASILSVDRLVLADLTPLFMGVWDTGDEFFAPRPHYYH